MRFSTRAIHEGKEPRGATGGVKPDICLSSTFRQESPGRPLGDHEYSRSGNPTREALERNIASLEAPPEMRDECHGLAYASGMAATTNVLFAFLARGDHVICSDDVYGGTFRVLTGKDFSGFEKFGVECDYVDMTDEALLKSTIKETTKLLWIETPTNPLLKLIDIRRVANIASDRGILSVVDNTFMSPYFQKPLTLGADIVVHSTTKYLGGHSDVVGGAVITKRKDHYERLKHYQNALGAIPAPFDCFMTMRGIETLPLRMEKHQENAAKVARFLEGHEKVAKALYPGLKSHLQHALAKKQMTGFGGMVCFYMKGNLRNATIFLESVRLFTLAESLGGTESLLEHPAIMTHASLPQETREALGISDTLIRLSVGIEDAQDLIDDLQQALTAS